MKKYLPLFILLSLIFTQLAFAQSDDIVIEIIDGSRKTCSQYLEEEGDTGVISYYVWLAAYLDLKIDEKSTRAEGVTIYIDTITKQLMTMDSYALFINPYCKKHPEESYQQAADAMTEALKRIQAKRGNEISTKCASYTKATQGRYRRYLDPSPTDYHMGLIKYLDLKKFRGGPKVKHSNIYTNTYIDPITQDHMTLTSYLLFIDPYCKAHPTHTFQQAINAMVADLKRMQTKRQQESPSAQLTKPAAQATAISLKEQK